MTGPPRASPDPAGLDAELRRLHGAPGAASALFPLHEAAAAAVGDAAGRRFHLTQAWVFALEAGDASAIRRLEAALRAAGGL